jgi:DeoR/GlpR family transcriptional regulator of sugar metabolism
MSRPVAIRPVLRRSGTAETSLVTVLVTDLVTATMECVSEMTIRHDCEVLEQTGIGRRVRGGITTLISRGYEPPRSYGDLIEMDAKARIAMAAVSLVSDEKP